MTLKPSYGRDYKSAKAVLDDWEAGKDFTLPTGQQINKADVERYGVGELMVRYDRLRKVVRVG